MLFEWDEAKSRRNLSERGFGFEYAARIFLNPTLERLDNRRDYGEVRIQGDRSSNRRHSFRRLHGSRGCPSYHFRAARQQEGA